MAQLSIYIYTSTDLTPERHVYILPHLLYRFSHDINYILSPYTLTVNLYYDSILYYYLYPQQGFISTILKFYFYFSFKTITLPQAGFLPLFYINTNLIKSLLNLFKLISFSLYPYLQQTNIFTTLYLSFISQLQALYSLYGLYFLYFNYNRSLISLSASKSIFSHISTLYFKFFKLAIRSSPYRLCFSYFNYNAKL